MEPLTTYTIGFILLALAAGVVLGWLYASRQRAVFEERARLLATQLEQAEAARATAEAQADERNRVLSDTLESRAARISELETELLAADRNRAESEARLNAVIADTRTQFTDTFKALANQILEEKTAKFTETNQSRLNELLTPFRERLKDFQKKIEETHLSETTERRSLKDELKRLMNLNQQVSQDTKNLTTALKGEAKTQGTWGEIILERVLEMSGLTRGREYEIQDSRVTEAGNRQQPDVLIHLPPDRNLIVDAKVSLVAFERYANAENDAARAEALAQHLQSLRTHIKGLSEKNYPALYGLESLDFVLMFVPIEPAFLAGVQADPGLYEAAWSKNVVLVSPTTLMATARVVESVWRLERQNRNVMKIAQQAGRMHDHFVSFVADLDKATRQFQSASDALDSAVKKLSSGRGNLVKRADDIRKLGAKAAKSLPAAHLDLTLDDDSDLAENPDGESMAGSGDDAVDDPAPDTSTSLRH
ncbi:MAG: DNA recombination protein RmuC [Gammaproteobacteria bacterium]